MHGFTSVDGLLLKNNQKVYYTIQHNGAFSNLQIHDCVLVLNQHEFPSQGAFGSGSESESESESIDESSLTSGECGVAC